jgi:hypothetical protein
MQLNWNFYCDDKSLLTLTCIFIDNTSKFAFNPWKIIEINGNALLNVSKIYLSINKN